MGRFAKTLTGSAALAAMTLATAPASAQGYYGYDRYDHRRDGISAGEVIAGAIVIGGLAAILSAQNQGRYGYDGYNGYNGYYGPRYGGARQAIGACVAVAQRNASRFGPARVTRITGIDRTPYGYRIAGRIQVQGSGYGGYGYDPYNRYGYGNGYAYGRDGWGGNDRGGFRCIVDRGRVVDINYRGLGWR